jgi:hypothetical protein
MKLILSNKRVVLVIGLLVSIIILTGLITKVKAQQVKVIKVSKVDSRYATLKRAHKNVHRKLRRRTRLRYVQLPKHRAVVRKIPSGAVVVKPVAIPEGTMIVSCKRNGRCRI